MGYRAVCYRRGDSFRAGYAFRVARCGLKGFLEGRRWVWGFLWGWGYGLWAMGYRAVCYRRGDSFGGGDGCGYSLRDGFALGVG
jgi:hypothetical protein